MNTKKLGTCMLLGGIGAAVAWYFTDPEKGERRRSSVARTAGRLLEKTRHEGMKTLRDSQNHLAGLAARIRSRVTVDEASDRVVEERIRSRMGRVVSAPRKIHVLCDHGAATLWGRVHIDEIHHLIRTVESTPGVKNIYDHLEIAEPEEATAAPANPVHEARRQTRLHWSPTRRLLVGAAGAGLALYGWRRKDNPGKATALLGAGMLLHSTMKHRMWATVALDETSPGFEIDKTIRINAPISDIYDFWVNPENYVEAFSHIAKVERLGENLYRWSMVGPASIPFGWEGKITKAVPNTLVEFKSLPGSGIGNFGSVRFDPNYDASTRVRIRMFYRPPAGILGRFVAELFGGGAETILDADLRRLKHLFESGKIVIRKPAFAEDEAESVKLATT